MFILHEKQKPLQKMGVITAIRIKGGKYLVIIMKQVTVPLKVICSVYIEGCTMDIRNTKGIST